MTTMTSSVHHTYNPLLLSRKPIVAEDVLKGGDVLGLVHTDLAQRPHNTYKILLFEEVCHFIHEHSPYYPTIKYPAIKLGVLAHECGHVWWGTVDNPVVLYLNNAIAKDIDNILSDTADEYRTMKRYRAYAKYVQLVLSCVKWETPSVIKGTWIDQDLHTLFLLTRFGVVMPGSDENFVSFIFPLIVSSRRGNRQNTLDAVLAVYTYMQIKSQQAPEMQKQWMEGIASQQDLRQVPLSQKEIDMILSSEQVDTSSVPFLMLQEAVTGVVQQGKQSMLGQLAGTDGPPPDDSEQTDEFFRTTVGLYPKVVMRLSALWMLRMHKITKYMRFEDGRIPRKKKRVAYKDARSGSEHRVHVGLKRNKPKVRVGILGDVSYSTKDFSTQYARAIVLLLASLEKKDDVKSAFAIFNSKFKVLMQFGDRVSKTKIRPQADGGTVLAPLLDEVATWVWDGVDNILIAITDGDIDKWHKECLPRLYALAKRGIRIIVVDIVEDESITFLHGTTFSRNDTPSWIHAFASTIENLPFKLMDAITTAQKVKVM